MQLDFKAASDLNCWSNGKLSSNELEFTGFLGLYSTDNPFPELIVAISPTGISTLFVSFYFYEIDSFDGDGKFGVDRFLVEIESGNHRSLVDFGWFHYAFDEPSAVGSTAEGLLWQRLSDLVEDSPQGFDPKFSDQRHLIIIEVPYSFFFFSQSLLVRPC